DADASLPALCITYPNVTTPGDAGASEPDDFLRFDLIALRALLSGETNAAASCQVGTEFASTDDPPPSQEDCLGQELAFLAGCAAPTNYQGNALDKNGARCVDDGGVVRLGFRDPATGNYTAQDVDFVIQLVRAAALSTGMTSADAERLVALLEAQKGSV